MYTHNKQSGFTLLELLVVVAILGILAAVGIPQYQGYQAASKQSATRTNHSNVVSYISSEFTKCSTGAATTMFQAPNTANCTDMIAAIATTFTAFAAGQNWQNPYQPSAVAVINTAAPMMGAVTGTTYVIENGANSVDITTFYDDSAGMQTSVSTNVIKE